MKLVTTPALVLRRINYAEADRIITVLSETNGRINLIAKGSRRLKSRLAGGIEPLSLNEITFSSTKKELNVLTAAQMIQAYPNLLADFNRNQQAHRFMFWLYRHIEPMAGQEYFPVFLAALRLLEAQQSDQLAFCYFYLRIFDLYGASFQLVVDKNNRPLASAAAYSFDSSSLSFYDDPKGVYRQDHIKLMRLLLSVDWQVLLRIKVAKGLIDAIAQLIKNHPVYIEPRGA